MTATTTTGTFATEMVLIGALRAYPNRGPDYPWSRKRE
jgi:hypothetical protein